MLSAAVVSVALASCHELPDYDNTPEGNFDALWNTINERYCFLDSKGINWDSIGNVYRPMALKARGSRGLFQICSAMLDELRDGHVNLSSPFATSYYEKWWTDYPDNYNERLIEQYYFHFNYKRLGNVTYGILINNVGYIRYPSFSSGLGDGNIDYILAEFAGCNGLIIDVRNNGGGDLTNVERWVSHFIRERVTAGYIIHKTGPGRNDFSEPFEYFIEPAGNGNLIWTKPVAVLADRSTFSAANNFVSVMKQLPNVRIVGATTGGGSGMPFSSELPNGWGIRFSATSILDAEHHTTEYGIEPSEGCAVNLDPAEALNGHDTILDFACSLMGSGVTPDNSSSNQP